jgi:hypothetical protein
MKTKNGAERKVRYQADGKPVMVPRLIYAEPALWDLMGQMAAVAGVTRSTYCRKVLKKAHAKCHGVEGVDWEE